jgi:hypothetical protein
MIMHTVSIKAITLFIFFISILLLGEVGIRGFSAVEMPPEMLYFIGQKQFFAAEKSGAGYSTP